MAVIYFENSSKKVGYFGQVLKLRDTNHMGKLASKKIKDNNCTWIVNLPSQQGVDFSHSYVSVGNCDERVVDLFCIKTTK